MAYFKTSLNIKLFDTYTTVEHPVSLVASNTGQYFSNVFRCLRCFTTVALVNELDCVCAHCHHRMFIKMPNPMAGGVERPMLRAW